VVKKMNAKFYLEEAGGNRKLEEGGRRKLVTQIHREI